MKISVCIAAYHGEKYLGEQLNSIVSQLGENDEIIISDDAPGGETQKIVEAFASGDNRIKYFCGNGLGVVKNFENAVSKASGDVIFLSDQDDVWLPQKTERVMAEFADGAKLVMHNASVTDENLNITAPSFFALRHSKPGFLRNLIRNTYMGCCMAFTREVAERSLPFPDNLPMHDQWIGLNAERLGGVRFTDEPLILYRRHGGNVTGARTGLKQKIIWRKNITKALLLHK